MPGWNVRHVLKKTPQKLENVSYHFKMTNYGFRKEVCFLLHVIDQTAAFQYVHDPGLSNVISQI